MTEKQITYSCALELCSSGPKDWKKGFFFNTRRIMSLMHLEFLWFIYLSKTSVKERCITTVAFYSTGVRT